MFGGQWKETAENCIHIDIPDENITEDGRIAISVVLSHKIMWSNVVSKDILICLFKF